VPSKTGKTILVQIRLPRKLVEEIDNLIRKGYYSSRTSFFEDAARRRLEEVRFASNELMYFVREYLEGKLERTLTEKAKIIIDLNEAKKRLKSVSLEDITHTMNRLRGRTI